MNSEEICKICQTAPSKYCCPRCNVLYCSLACYKSSQHLQCSESFYKENVIQEMTMVRDEQQAQQSSHKMLEILSNLEQNDLSIDEGTEAGYEEDEDEDRFEEIDSDDAEDVPDLSERLGKVNLDDPNAVWERLTEEERKDFQSLLENGDVGRILPEVDPWWNGEFKVELVQAAESKVVSKGESHLLETCPSVKRVIRSFSELSSKPPSPLMRYNVTNILAAYAFVFRYFNGDFTGNAPEVVNTLISIAGNFKQNSNYDSQSLAVESVCHECRQEQLPADKETSRLLTQDVEKLLAGPEQCGQKYRKHFLLAALSDVHRLIVLTKGYDGEKTKASRDVEGGEFSSKFKDDIGELKYLEPVKVRSYLKKIEFMLSYAKDHV
ncbi:zinc finger HIT domain-containing protein 2 [Culex pipiens pallens]|uniref:zinc finger HIT domain-containing protein 2 n=1 Tax=Culex pipiens pallens TaxID=42434 RepID=UPI001953ABE2|nr:zinc finger HIT domain-containing protein 2 [Culex pipiens pallens]